MEQAEIIQINPVLRFTAKLISYVLHPLFIPTYFFSLLVWLFPSEFTVALPFQLTLKLFSTFWMTAFFPAFAVFLLWKLKLSNSIYLRTQQERIAPYVITMFFYWWMYYLGRNMTDQPAVLKFFYFGIFLATIVGLIANNFFKISLHATGAGGALAAIILFAFFYHTNLNVVIVLIILLAGIVCTARLLLNTHNAFEVYTGLFSGIICQLLAYWWVM
jgi:membrane-associated phospholipid phosphatase